TNLEKIPFSICPMTLQEMDEKGDLWFFTGRNSDHFKNIENDNRVQLIVSETDDHTYISLYGNAVHIVDDEKVEQLWNPMLQAWFNGKNDSNLALLNVNVESAFYWDNDQNKLVSLYQMVKAMTTEEKAELGKKGHINLQNH
ncbi:MAG: pyridoxamine 5'-phosphate oxidase family protein, partial [Flavobacteriaceae bacterium]